MMVTQKGISHLCAKRVVAVTQRWVVKILGIYQRRVAIAGNQRGQICDQTAVGHKPIQFSCTDGKHLNARVADERLARSK